MTEFKSPEPSSRDFKEWPQHPTAKASTLASKIRRNSRLREFLAEFTGTYVLVLLGGASVAEIYTSHEGIKDTFSINWSWGIGVMMGVLIAGEVTGAHLNPAISLALALSGRLRWSKVPVYWLAQYFGAFLASASALGFRGQAILNMKNKSNATITDGKPGTAGMFATYPVYLSTWGAVGEQILGSYLLMLCVCALKDEKNKIPPSLAALYHGLSIIAVGICFGSKIGYTMNPAHDLMPRFLTWIMGWGDQVFTYRNNWFWVPVVAPHIGAIFAIIIYFLFIEAHWPDTADTDQESKGPQEASKEKD